MPYTIEEFDALPGAAAEAELLACCTSPVWAARVAAGRPFGDRAALLRAAADAALELTAADLEAALAGHPRIGERSASESSRREQAAVATAEAEVLAAIAAGNAAYEDKFGHVYLVRAAGRSVAGLLEILQRRLGNDRDTELDEVRAALADINRLRLERLVTEATEPAQAAESTARQDTAAGSGQDRRA